MHLKRYMTAAALCALVAAGLSAETALNVQKAVESAIKNNLTLQRSKIEVEAKKNARDLSWNTLIPQATASTGASRQNEAAGSPEWTPSASLSLSMNLSPSIVSSMEKAKLEYEAGLIDYELAERAIELAVRKAFNQLLVYEANIDIADRKIETARSRYEQTAAMAKVGQASRLAVLSAQVDLESLKPARTSAETTYEDALDDFKLLIGLPVQEEVVLEGSLETGATAETIVSRERVGDSSNVVSLARSLEIAEASKKVARDEALMPTLTLSYGTRQTYANDDWTDSGSLSVGLSLRLDGFLPWSSTKQKLDQYDDTAATIASRIAEAELASDTNIRQLRRSVEKSFASLEALKLNVELAEKSYAMYEESYAAGTSDLQSLKSAGDSLEEARLGVLKELFALSNAILDLENELNLPFGSIGN